MEQTATTGGQRLHRLLANPPTPERVSPASHVCPGKSPGERGQRAVVLQRTLRCRSLLRQTNLHSCCRRSEDPHPRDKASESRAADCRNLVPWESGGKPRAWLAGLPGWSACGRLSSAGLKRLGLCAAVGSEGGTPGASAVRGFRLLASYTFLLFWANSEGQE